jgi:hypothetical protein
MQCVDHIIEVLDLGACQDTSKYTRMSKYAGGGERGVGMERGRGADGEKASISRNIALSTAIDSSDALVLFSEKSFGIIGAAPVM